MRDDAIGFALKAACAVPECPDVAAWWPQFREAARVWRNPMDRAIAAGFSADRVAWAFASGYQAALHALFPGAPEDRICALCVTEAEGNSPKAIKSSLRRNGNDWLLSGAKRWTTLGPDGALFFVAARDEAASRERAALRVARVASGSRGLKTETMPPTRFVPEVPHAQLQFDNIAVAGDAILPGDGYDNYVKPFRTVEDLHVNAAILAYLLREARRLSWPAAWLERTAATLFSFLELSGEDASSPVTHIALAGALSVASGLIGETEDFWGKAQSDPASPRWQRDRDLLKVAGSARELRATRAWDRLKSARAF